MAINDLLSRVRDTLFAKTQDNQGWIRQGKFTPVQQLGRIGSDLGYEARNAFNQGVHNAWSPQGVATKATNAIQGGITNVANWKRIELPKPQVKNQIGQTAINLAFAIPESIANTPRNYLTGIARTGLELGTAQKEGRRVNYENLAGGIAPLAESIYDVSTLGGAKVVKNIAKEGIEQVARGGLKYAVKKGATKGALVGGFGGLTYGLDTQYGKDFKTGEVLTSVLGGVALGGTLGGVTAGLGYGYGKLVDNVSKNIKKLKPDASDVEIKNLAKTYIQDEAGLMKGSRPKDYKKKVVFYGDLRESLGLSRYGEDLPQIGNSIRKLTPEEHADLISRQSTKGLEAKTKPAVQTSMAQAEAQALQTQAQPQSLSGSQMDQPGNLVPSSGVEGTLRKVSQGSLPQDKYAGSVNVTKLKISPEEKKTLRVVSDVAKDELQKAKGKVLSNKEVLSAAKESQVLQGVVTREQTLQAEAALLKARQQVVSLDKEVTELAKKGNTPLLQKKMSELLESLKTVNANASDRGRQLQALSIDAGDESIRMKLLKDIYKVETDSAKILREAANVNWENANDVASFYRKFIKPSVTEVLDEYRYNNMLSSPRTHIRNAFSNLVQTFVTRPATLAAQGKVGEAGQYYKGAITSLPDAVDDFSKAFKGETAIGQQDIKNIPTGKLPKLLTIPSKLLEASDRFFTKLITGGELATGATAKQAEDVAAYSLFRQGLRPEGQGKLLNAIDSVTAWTYKAPKAVRWFVPFIRTPMNFAKQWVEYSPLGIATLPGAANKKEQLAKTIIGSTVATIGAKFALDGNTTWSAPTDPKEKEIFYASGRKPFSVKIGDKWVSMMYAGPFAQALALPAAVKYYQDDNRTSLTDSQLDKLGKITMSMAEYLSGQTFLDGMNNFVRFFSGDADYTFAKNLGYTAGQVLPLQGLVRWTNTILDPVYRRATTFGEQIQSGIPGMSQKLEPYLTPDGQPSTREGINAITPYDISTSKSQYDPALEQRQQKLQENAVLNQAKKDMEKQVSSGGVKQVGKTVVYTEDGVVKTFAVNDLPQPPKLTGQAEVDKGLKSRYSSQLTAYKNDILKLVELGQMTPDEAEAKLREVTALKNKSKTGSRATKNVTIKKITAPKITIAESKRSLPKITLGKTPRIKIVSPPKVKTIKIAKAKKPKKLTIVRKNSNLLTVKPKLQG